MKYLILLLFIPFLFTPIFAQSNSQTLPTEKGTLDIKLSYDNIIPGELSVLKTDFINPQTKKIQEHIDWRVKVLKEGEVVWGPTDLSHTATGSLSNLKVEFPDKGTYSVEFEIEGILFAPIPVEKASFDVVVGQTDKPKPNPPKPNGCLIATATYGSEMAPQVQFLREIRDNKLMNTQSGTSFMSGFNQFYYSFSPYVADYERENPVFKEAIKIAITPLLASLSILSVADSEQEVLGLGIGVILMNIGMYVGIPAFGVLKFYQFVKNKN